MDSKIDMVSQFCILPGSNILNFYDAVTEKNYPIKIFPDHQSAYIICRNLNAAYQRVCKRES